MRLLLDQCVTRLAAPLLAAAGHEVVHALDVGLDRTPDRRILVWCRDHGRVLITIDQDFHALLALAGSATPSVVRIRQDWADEEALARLVLLALETFPEEIDRGAAVTVRDDKVRCRLLPLRDVPE